MRSLKIDHKINPEINDMQPSDPYEVFGFGIVAYFSAVRHLIWAMTVLTILFIPVIYIYY